MSERHAESATRRLGQLMHRLRGLASPSPEDLVDIDLPRRQLWALFIVTRHGPLSVSALAQATDASVASVSSLAERLVRSGHLRREADPQDRRVVLLSATEQGESVVDRLQSRSHARFDRLVEAMSPEGRAALEAGLTDMMRAADELGLLADDEPHPHHESHPNPDPQHGDQP